MLGCQPFKQCFVFEGCLVTDVALLYLKNLSSSFPILTSPKRKVFKSHRHYSGFKNDFKCKYTGWYVFTLGLPLWPSLFIFLSVQGFFVPACHIVTVFNENIFLYNSKSFLNPHYYLLLTMQLFNISNNIKSYDYNAIKQ